MELPWDDLLAPERYPTLQAGRVHMQTSRGCPSRCGFCYNTGFNERRWRGKSPARVVDEMQYLLQRFPQVRIVDPVDDNFFVDRRRAGHLRGDAGPRRAHRLAGQLPLRLPREV